MNVVVLRRRPDGSLSVGAPNSIDPCSGEPFEDIGPTWRTHNKLCPTCGEMIGTARRRSRYARNRWPVTVHSLKCHDCGKEICEACYYSYETGKVIGIRKRRTEGGHYVSAPKIERIVLCKECLEKRVANRIEEKNSQIYECPECGYKGRRDTFGIEKTLAGQEYVKKCPKCGFSWEPGIMGVFSDEKQKRIKEVKS